MIVTGYILFVLMGLTLGLLGAGGSILTIPILLYFFNLPVMLATTYSLAIVGIVALFSLVAYREEINSRAAFLFAVPSISTVFLTRFYLIPHLPETLFGMLRDHLFMGLLVCVMFGAAGLMIRGSTPTAAVKPQAQGKVVIIASALGVVMGLLGAGGGFLIIPTLVLLVGLEMHAAVATSLFIIMLNSAIGFGADRQILTAVDYQHLALLMVLALGGMWGGVLLHTHLSGPRLRQSFGWFIGIVAALITVKELHVF